MRIVAIIVNYRTPQLVLECLEALAADRRLLSGLKAVVVDNASGDGSAALLSAAVQNPSLREWVEFLPLPANGGFGWGNNQAILHTMGSSEPPEAFFLLNPDTRIEPGALQALSSCLQQHPDAGAVGSQLLNPDGTLSGSAFRFPTVAREFIRGLGIGVVGRLLGIAPVLVPYGVRRPVDWVTGASLLLRTKALEECGLFDTGFFLYFEEVELMHRFAKRGWHTCHCPESRVMHIAGVSTGVVEGKADGARVPPDYLFQSRRRYFALTGGRSAAFLANLAWLFGDALSRILSASRVRRSSSLEPEERRALMRLGLRARAADCRSAFDRVSDQPGKLPSWMNH